MPGWITYGDEFDEAMIMAKEEVELFIEELNSLGEDIPDDSKTLEYSPNLITV